MNFKIEGGRKLTGTVTTNTAKNSVVALMATALLNRGQTTLENVPKVEDVNRLIELLISLGVKVIRQGNNLTIRPPAKINFKNADKEAAASTRSSLLLLGALSGWSRAFLFPKPGGCRLGDRTIAPHLFALETLGIKIGGRGDVFEIKVSEPRSRREVVLYEMSDTATINALLVAASRSSETVIKFAATNYMVQDACDLLEKLGVAIGGIGSSTLIINGVEKINQVINYPVGEDPVEAMFFLALAATTGSHLTIKRAPIDFLELELLKLAKMGFKYKIIARYQATNGKTKLVDIETKPSNLKALEDKIHPLPYPGINIDNLPFFVPIATQAKGKTLIHDWVYDGRAIYYMELAKLGADIVLADPHRVFIEGQTKLRGAEIICPAALRPAAIILIAMLAAKGPSILRNIYSISRGYENLVTRLKKLGAKIELLTE